MKRRDLLLSFGTAITAVVSVRAEKAIPVIGYLAGATPEANTLLLLAFRNGLKETGYIEGQNVIVDYRWAENHYDRLPWLAADLVNRKVDVIVSAGGITGALAAKNATSAIPIVFVVGDDPVERGLVDSLRRPGGNLTGGQLPDRRPNGQAA
jgi:putative tryptophan/tyrosine transport system substrate-binding protein